jgi:hypothetical protein
MDEREAARMQRMIKSFPLFVRICADDSWPAKYPKGTGYGDQNKRGRGLRLPLPLRAFNGREGE